ncbi:unnamed protein product, partial [Ectocarpus sp. 12 AP-2014]
MEAKGAPCQVWFDDRKSAVCDAPSTGEASQSCGGVAAFDVHRLIRNRRI